MKVVLADYGAGNLRSLSSALLRAGAEPMVTTDPEVVSGAPLAMIAGVGHVGSAAGGLRRNGLDDALRERVATGRPVAGICVGMQLLFEESDEGGRGSGCSTARSAAGARRVPHMGWNALEATRPSAILDGLEGADVYFAHSFAAVPADDDVTAATVDHDGAVVAAVEHGPLAGVQFHPERSGPAGGRSSRTCCDGQEARDPLPRRRGRSRRQGRQLRNLREMGDPVELARRYSELGADELVFLDITATLEGRGPILDVIAPRRRRADDPFTAGGGVTRRRRRARAAPRGGGQGRGQPRRLRRARDPRGLADEFGAQAVVVAIDARAARSSTHAGREPRGRDAVGWAREAVERGAGEILLTSIDADGTREGYDLG